MVFNERRFQIRVSKLYQGMLKRYKEGIKNTGKRINPSSAQGQMVVDNCQRRCTICLKPYDKDPGDFEIHHLDGDRSNTITDNLELLCHSCHKKAGVHARAKLKDYKQKQGKAEQSKPVGHTQENKPPKKPSKKRPTSVLDEWNSQQQDAMNEWKKRTKIF
ncbi:HNH endonuclease [Methanoculleus sp. FWC-SCC1]|uniref:HNH endonuclease n=1 Tax=Methanoculleus frigidifontis TaxID=2584085 RepID=A0ABT8MDI7_9EURY|nr:HNH endonuclease signature motif containing protein [Methanoculleus sp. FWC-SCC1]MDN7026005.1 HNH endonuclease [Methanoculleus sp. FWC-SCC1]